MKDSTNTYTIYAINNYGASYYLFD